MLVECIPRPELRAPVLELISQVSTAHAQGEFTIALAEMFVGFGLHLEPSEWSKLRARGEVRFVPRTSAQGEVANQGQRQELAAAIGLTVVSTARTLRTSPPPGPRSSSPERRSSEVATRRKASAIC